MGRSETFQWFSRFKAGRTSIDDERFGRPVSSSTPEMIERVRQIIREDRRRTIDEVSMLVGISYGNCHIILTEDLKMRRVASKFVPRLLSVDNVPAYAALLTRRFLTDNNRTVVPHPPYSLDLAPCDFFLFPKLKMKLKGGKISDGGGNSSRVAGGPEHAARKWLPGMLKKLAAPLGSLSSLRRGLL